MVSVLEIAPIYLASNLVETTDRKCRPDRTILGEGTRSRLLLPLISPNICRDKSAGTRTRSTTYLETLCTRAVTVKR
jgi:hypothetical protein